MATDDERAVHLKNSENNNSEVKEELVSVENQKMFRFRQKIFELFQYMRNILAWSDLRSRVENSDSEIDATDKRRLS